MFAIAALIAFAIALIMHLIGHGLGTDVTTAWLLGLVFLAAHCVFGGGLITLKRGDN